MTNTNWSKYYTPKPVANEILSMLPKNFNPTKVIDICVGSGNFLEAALMQWNNINAIGVDINLDHINSDVKYVLYEMNALNINLLNKTINSDDKDVKVVLANPPFGKINFTFEPLNEGNKLNLIYKEAVRIKRIEALMLVSNLSILHKGDYFAAILPENFFNSVRLSRFKEMFMNAFTNITIGNREKYFNNSEVKTRIFIGKYVGSTNLNNLKVKKKELQVNPNYVLHRGIDNSKLLSINNEGIEVVHFSNIKGIQKLKRYYPKSKTIEKLIISENDTLILRVGRNSGYTFSAKKEYIDKCVSDYFYILKGIHFNNKEHQILQKLLLNKRKGITTNYLNKIDIISSINNVLNLRSIL